MRIVSRMVAILLWAAVAVLALLGAQAPWSPSGWVALAAVAVGGLVLFIAEPRPRRVLAAAGLILILVVIVVRGIGTGSGLITMRTLPSGDGARWLGRLLDEQDLALAGERVLGMRWPFSGDERQGLLRAMGDAYAAMRRDDAYSPTPVIDTLLGRQKPDGFDTLIIEPRAESRPTPPKFGVIFLHGFAGSFTVECWLVASAAREIGALTVCPATDFNGHWRGDAGEKILRATLDHLHARGIKRVFLAGLSNGAVGASELAPRFASSLEGVILISGAPPTGGAAGLPTLVVQGAHDAVAPASAARAFAERTHGTYAEFEGGHFVLLMRRAETRAALVNWLMRQAGYRRSEGNLR